MKLLIVATFLSSFVLADDDKADVSTLESDIKKMEDELEYKVKKYNEALRDQHKGNTPAQEKIEKAHNTPEAQKDEQLDAKIKDLTDKIERLEKEVKSIRQDISKTKPTENLKKEEATKKAALEDKHEIPHEAGQAQFDLAVKLMPQDPTKSIESFSEIMKNNKGKPISTSAAIKIGDAYFKLGKWDLAFKTFQNALELPNITVTQKVDANLGSAEAQCANSDRKGGCRTLMQLDKSNLPMTSEQTNRYQSLLVSNHCASSMDKDKKNDALYKIEEYTGVNDD